MTRLAETDSRRLIKLLGMLGSDYAGERDAAGLKACKLLRDNGVTWEDLLSRGQTTSRSRPSSERQPVNGAAHAAELLVCGHPWNNWEIGFLTSLSGWNGDFTPKQSIRLNDLKKKCDAWLAKQKGN